MRRRRYLAVCGRALGGGFLAGCAAGDGSGGVERLEARVLVDGELVASWHVETEWVEQHLAGEISRDELAERVAATVERTGED